MTPSTIVVPLDGSPLGETALAPGRDLAARFDADLLLVRATWRQPPDEEEHYLGGLATNLGHDRTSIRAVHGFPAPSIAAIVEDLTSPLLCLATRGHTGLVGNVLLGGVAAELVGDAAVPSVLVGPSVLGSHLGDPPQGSLVFCFDGSFAARSLEAMVLRWAERLDLPVDAITVLHRDGEFLGGVSAKAVCVAAEEFVARARARGVPCEHVIVDGIEPAQALLRAAHQHDAALIAAGATAAHRSHGLARFSRSVLGSTAERLVRHATAPVLIAQP